MTRAASVLVVAVHVPRLADRVALGDESRLQPPYELDERRITVQDVVKALEVRLFVVDVEHAVGERPVPVRVVLHHEDRVVAAAGGVRDEDAEVRVQIERPPVDSGVRRCEQCRLPVREPVAGFPRQDVGRVRDDELAHADVVPTVQLERRTEWILQSLHVVQVDSVVPSTRPGITSPFAKVSPAARWAASSSSAA